MSSSTQQSENRKEKAGFHLAYFDSYLQIYRDKSHEATTSHGNGEILDSGREGRNEGKEGSLVGIIDECGCGTWT